MKFFVSENSLAIG